MKLKRWISLILSLAICLSLYTIPAHAQGEDTSAPSADQQVMDYALHFMTRSQEDPNITIRDFLPLTDGCGNTTGYYVSFDNLSGPAGYTLLSLITGGDPLVEFAFEGDGLFSVEETALYTADPEHNDAEEGTSGIIYRGPGEIYLPIEDDTYYSVYNHKTTTIDTSIAPHFTIEGGIFDWEEAYIKNSSVFKISNFGAGTDYWLMEDFGVGSICAPASAANILWYWYKQRNRSSVINRYPGITEDETLRRRIYETLHYGMETKVNEGTKLENILKGYTMFFNAQPAAGGVWNYKEIYKGASFGMYKTELNDNCPIHLHLRTRRDPNAEDYHGHSVMLFGYADDTSGFNHYYFVMDGWNNYGRFVRHGYFPSIVGHKIWVG